MKYSTNICLSTYFYEVKWSQLAYNFKFNIKVIEESQIINRR